MPLTNPKLYPAANSLCGLCGLLKSPCLSCVGELNPLFPGYGDDGLGLGAQ